MGWNPVETQATRRDDRHWHGQLRGVPYVLASPPAHNGENLVPASVRWALSWDSGRDHDDSTCGGAGMSTKLQFQGRYLNLEWGPKTPSFAGLESRVIQVQAGEQSVG